jgi:cytidylate kinase
MTCVLLSGAIGAGKTTVANLLATNRGAKMVRVRSALAEVLGVDVDNRLALQEEGARLDQLTDGRWLADYLIQLCAEFPELVVDSLRTERQTRHVVANVGKCFLVYLDATTATRERRFAQSEMSDPVKRSMPLSEAMTHPTEREVLAIRDYADLIIETDKLRAEEVVLEVQRALTETELRP